MKDSYFITNSTVLVVVLGTTAACGGASSLADAPRPHSGGPSSSNPAPRSKPSATPTTTSEPEPNLVDGGGFTLKMPPGWADETASAQSEHPNVLVEIRTSGAFLTVYDGSLLAPRYPAGTPTARAQLAKDMRAITHSKPHPAADLMLDGETTMGASASEGPLTFIEYVPIRDGIAYVIFIGYPDQYSAGAKAAIAQVAKSWDWTP
jgi:hypothetical protein